MNLMKYKKWYLLLSVLFILPGFVSLVMHGLNFGIDFVGGSEFKYTFAGPDFSNEMLLEVFNENGIEVRGIEVLGDNKVMVRTVPVSAKQNESVTSALVEKLGEVKQDGFETIGPSVGSETRRKSLTALGVSIVGILLYIAFAFRNIPSKYKSYKFGVVAVVAMTHDALIVIGVFSILGHVFNVEIDALFITALLTVIGFSVHDTIVVFDRVRENLKKLSKSRSFEEVVNHSVVETLNRSVATSLTVLLVLLSLFLLGGESIRYFVLALLVGIFAGTYSSIFTACPILVYWEDDKKKIKSHK